MNPRIQQLQEQGYSLSHASMIATVEWALYRNGSFEGCRGCNVEVYTPATPVRTHRPNCPIPALGYAVLHEQHWYRKHDPGTFCAGCFSEGEVFG